MVKTIFSNKKYILSSGRELDLSAERVEAKVVVSAMFNYLDPVQGFGHSALIRIESDQSISFESIGSSCNSESDERIKEIAKPIDGLNGADILLKIFEFNELISVMQQFLQKIDKEAAVKK